RDVDRALVAQLGHPGESVGAYYVEVGVALQRFGQMRERAIVAGFAQRKNSFGLDEVARVAGLDDVRQRGCRACVAAKISERAHDCAPRLRMRQLEALDECVE